jgi:hypothetical protein
MIGPRDWFFSSVVRRGGGGSKVFACAVIQQLGRDVTGNPHSGGAMSSQLTTLSDGLGLNEDQSWWVSPLTRCAVLASIVLLYSKKGRGGEKETGFNSLFACVEMAERLRQTAIDRLLVSMHGGLAGMRPVLIMSTGLLSCAFHSIPLSLPPKVVLPETALPETE